MKLKRKLIIVFACLLSLALILSACGSKATDQSAATTAPAAVSSSTDSSAAAADKVDPLGKYSSPVEISVAFPMDTNAQIKDGSTFENNIWLKTYEEYGIKMTYPFKVDLANYPNKMNVILASGDLPDMMAVNMPQLKQLADAGQIEDVTQVFDQWASPITKEMLSSDGNLGLDSSRINRKLLALPSTSDLRPSVLFIRYDWLKKLNLPEPKTMGDVLKISEAFTKNDPDGNGKADTYGLALSKNLKDVAGDFAGFANAYHAYPKQWFKNDEGQIVYGSIQPEMKNVLAQLQKMYKDGELDKEFATKDTGKIGESITANKGGMVFGQWWLPTWPLQTAMDKNPNMDWRAYPIMSIDEKPAKVQYDFPVNPISGWFVEKKGIKNPEIVVKMMNIWFDKVYSSNADFGKYCIAPDGTQFFKYCPIYSWPGKDERGQHISEALKNNSDANLNQEEKVYYGSIQKFKSGDRSQWFNYGNYGDVGAQRIMSDVYFANNLGVAPAFYGVPTKTMQEKQASLDKLENETFTKIIMGAAPVDEFDKFVDNWKKLAGDQITTEVNAWAAAH